MPPFILRAINGSRFNLFTDFESTRADKLCNVELPSTDKLVNAELTFKNGFVNAEPTSKKKFVNAESTSCDPQSHNFIFFFRLFIYKLINVSPLR